MVQIKEHPSYYITEDGTVCDRSGAPKSTYINKQTGYITVSLDGKNCTIHRLVAEAFCSHPPNTTVVNHKDGNKVNNNANNLEWTTHSGNMQHAVDNKLRTYESMQKISPEVLPLIFTRMVDGESVTTLAQKYNVAPGTLSERIRKYATVTGQVDTLHKARQAAYTRRNKAWRRKTTKVIQLTMEGQFVQEFPSLTAARLQLGAKSTGPISNAISGRSKSAYGFKWTTPTTIPKGSTQQADGCGNV